MNLLFQEFSYEEVDDVEYEIPLSVMSVVQQSSTTTECVCVTYPDLSLLEEDAKMLC